MLQLLVFHFGALNLYNVEVKVKNNHFYRKRKK